LLVDKITEGSLKFVLPEEGEEGQWSVQVVGGANAYTLNAPEPWWAQGDKQKTATPGGYVRVFGSAVSFETSALIAARRALATATSDVAQLVQGVGEDGAAATSMGAAEAALGRLAIARHQCRILAAATGSQLRLTVVGKPPVMIAATAESTTKWSAWFDLPTSIAPGTYTVEIANGLAPDHFVPMSSFVSPSEPTVSTVTVVAAAAALKPWERADSKVFKVSDFGPFGLPNLQNVSEWTNASVAIEKAIAAAGAAGGGTVFFERGTYFVNSTWGFDIPWGVKLAGEGKELVQLIFAETYSVSDAGPIKPNGPGSGALALFRGPEVDSGAWAISDLTVCVPGAHLSR
jgi:hypothetical protein